MITDNIFKNNNLKNAGVIKTAEAAPAPEAFLQSDAAANMEAEDISEADKKFGIWAKSPALKTDIPVIIPQGSAFLGEDEETKKGSEDLEALKRKYIDEDLIPKFEIQSELESFIKGHPHKG